MKFTLQQIETAHNGYSDWPTFILRDEKTNVAIAEIGHIDHYFGQNNKTIADNIARACNNFDELLTCCKRALKESARVHPDFMEQLQRVIAAAEKPNLWQI